MNAHMPILLSQVQYSPAGRPLKLNVEYSSALTAFCLFVCLFVCLLYGHHHILSVRRQRVINGKHMPSMIFQNEALPTCHDVHCLASQHYWLSSEKMHAGAQEIELRQVESHRSAAVWATALHRLIVRSRCLTVGVSNDLRVKIAPSKDVPVMAMQTTVILSWSPTPAHHPQCAFCT